jgi:hypothetical protein
LGVVFGVAGRGGMCGERGVLAPQILMAKNTPGFLKFIFSLGARTKADPLRG